MDCEGELCQMRQEEGIYHLILYETLETIKAQNEILVIILYLHVSSQVLQLNLMA